MMNHHSSKGGHHEHTSLDRCSRSHFGHDHCGLRKRSQSEPGTGVGAVGGALVGNAIGGNTASTVGGAAIGGLIGNQVGRNADERNYYNQQRYPRGSGYYPGNGPNY